MQRNAAIRILAILLVGAISMLAHEEVRVIGVVTKKETSAIKVKAEDGKILSIALNKETKISRDKKPVTASELKAGLTVVVDALGDSDDDLVALEVRIVPPIARSTRK